MASITIAEMKNKTFRPKVSTPKDRKRSVTTALTPPYIALASGELFRAVNPIYEMRIFEAHNDYKYTREELSSGFEDWGIT